MHIGDYAYPRKDFRVWCKKHIDEAPVGSILFEMADPWRCVILGPDVGSDLGNQPNVIGKMKCMEKCMDIVAGWKWKEINARE